MRVACGLAWLSLLASATALYYPAVRGHLSCVARVNPAMARLGKPTAVMDADGSGPVPWAVTMGRYHGPLPWADVTYSHPPSGRRGELLQELDAIEPTLSYQGWQKDVAEIEDSYIQMGSDHSLIERRLYYLRLRQERLDMVLGWLQALNELKATLSYDGWQEDAAEIEEQDCKLLGIFEDLDEDWDGEAEWDEPDPVPAMNQMRRKQQVHERRLTRPGWPVPLDQIDDDDDDDDDSDDDEDPN